MGRYQRTALEVEGANSIASSSSPNLLMILPAAVALALWFMQGMGVLSSAQNVCCNETLKHH